MNRITGGVFGVDAEERETENAAGKKAEKEIREETERTAGKRTREETERTAGKQTREETERKAVNETRNGTNGKAVKKKASFCALIFFVLLLIYGCFAFDDYGISVDENVERNTCLVTYKHLFPSVADIVTDSVNFPEIEALDTYTDRYYGVAVQLPTIVVEHLFGFRLPLRTVYLIRHFYTFLLFYGAAIVLYLLGKRITGNQWGALLGAVMLVLSPRMLAESFYNIKDIVFLSLVIDNLYAGICFLDKPTVKKGIVLAVVSALCINVRVVGAVVLASCLAVGFLKKSFESKGMIFAKQCLLLLMVLAVSIGVYILSLPVLWKNPVAELANTVKTFSDFTNWDDIFRYRGFAVRGNNLPRSYLFVWIFISTPVLYLVLFGLGIAERLILWVRELAALVRGRKKLAECPELWWHIFFGMVLVIPLCYVVLRRPTLYNGWRHFYFLYAVMMIYAVYGAMLLWRLAVGWDERRRRYAEESKERDENGSMTRNGARDVMRPGKGLRGRWGQAVCAALLLICMLPTLGWMVRNHPYEYMYFNPFVRNYALQSFELDYWAVSEADMFRYICDHDDREEIKVWCTFSDFYKSLMMLTEEDRTRLVYADTPMEADYAVCRDLMKTSAEQMERQFAFEEVYSVVVDGRTINSVFRRTDDAVMRSMAAWDGEELFSSGNGVAWNLVQGPIIDGAESVADEAGLIVDGAEPIAGRAEPATDGTERESGAEQKLEGAALVSDLGREMNLTKISLRHESQPYLEGLRCYASADGENWTELQPVERNGDYIVHNERTVFRCNGPARYLKLIHREKLIPEDGAALALEAEVYADRGTQTEQFCPPMIERVTGHENSVASEQAVDGSMMSRWQSEDVQRQGIAFDIVLNDVYLLSGIRLDTGDAPNEYPRALRIFVSEDDVEWEELSVESRDQILFTFPDTNAKTIRLITGNMDGMDVQDRWSIYEISLMRRIE